MLTYIGNWKAIYIKPNWAKIDTTLQLKNNAILIRPKPNRIFLGPNRNRLIGAVSYSVPIQQPHKMLNYFDFNSLRIFASVFSTFVIVVGSLAFRKQWHLISQHLRQRLALKRKYCKNEMDLVGYKNAQVSPRYVCNKMVLYTVCICTDMYHQQATLLLL